MMINGYEFDYITDDYVKYVLETFEEFSNDSELINNNKGKLKHFLKDNPNMIPLTKRMIKMYCNMWPRYTLDGMEEQEKIINECYEKYGKEYWNKKQTKSLIFIATLFLCHATGTS